MLRIVSTKPDNPIGLAALALGAALSAGLAGCGGGFTANMSSSSATAGAALHGTVHGGQNPISGASVYLSLRVRRDTALPRRRCSIRRIRAG